MTVLRVSLVAALMVALVAAGWLAFVPQRPVPEGPHGVGRMDAALTDSAGRPLPLTIWYPAEGPRGRVVADALLARAGGPAPLILYSPGWGGARTQSSIQAENLASHGFVVVACDDVSSDAATRPDDGPSFDMDTDATRAASLGLASRHVLVQGARLVDVLDAVEAGRVPRLAGRVDLARVGAMGYSVGGSSVLQAGLLDPRIVAILNIDGALLGPSAEQIGPQAYFLLSSREAFPTVAEETSSDPAVRGSAWISLADIPRNRRRMERPGNYWAVIDAATHEDMSDGLFAVHRSNLLRLNIQRTAIDTAIRRFAVAFFESALLGEPAALRTLVADQPSSARWISSTPAASGTASATQ
ncbi:alpha/beta hydrolase family protein [Reyranella sp.]|uniref:alpha/beta hydrolase family protein n=1 Tax=Reyranella sp. TaxID=1929291 RepID=UPI003BAB0E03